MPHFEHIVPFKIGFLYDFAWKKFPNSRWVPWEEWFQGKFALRFWNHLDLKLPVRLKGVKLKLHGLESRKNVQINSPWEQPLEFQWNLVTMSSDSFQVPSALPAAWNYQLYFHSYLDLVFMVHCARMNNDFFCQSSNRKLFCLLFNINCSSAKT